MGKVSEKYYLKPLCAQDVLGCKKAATTMVDQRLADDMDVESYSLLTSLCEHAALVFYCTYCDGERFFSSPDEVLEKLKIAQLCDIFEAYLDLANE